jgi:AraC-like DNA-binding protein
VRNKNILRIALGFEESLVKADDWERAAKEANYNLSKMASMFCLSERQLQRVFKKNLQRTPSQWLRELKCRLAQELISQGYSTKAAAAELNFSTESHFCHAFRKVFGTSPQAAARNRGFALRITSIGKALDFSSAPRV